MSQWKGIVVDSCNPGHLQKLGFAYDEEEGGLSCEDLDTFSLLMVDRGRKIETVSAKYACGQDDGKDFYLSDQQEGIEAIAAAFPEFQLSNLNPDHYPLDYDYRDA